MIPDGELAHHYFERFAVAEPERDALLEAGVRTSIGVANRRANGLAHRLVALGAQADDRVSLLLERSAEAIVAMLGVLKSGAAFVPLDPANPPLRISTILEDAAPRVVVCDNATRHLVPDVIEQVVSLDDLEEESRDLNLNIASNSLAYVIYTSGSTGVPKGVMIEHGSLAWYTKAAGDYYSISGDDVVLQCTSLSFDWCIDEIFHAQTRGGCTALSPDLASVTVDELLDGLSADGVTVAILPTPYWAVLTEHLAASQRSLPVDLRLVVIGGERALPDQVRMWHRLSGVLPRLVNGYGPTEATCGATVCDLSTYEIHSREVPIGLPLRGARAYVLDPDQQVARAGDIGELFIAGPGVARGYLNQPAATASAFPPDIVSDKERMYRTGDLARVLTDGNLEYLGRVDHQLKVRGFRVEPAEIEAALMALPGVRDCVAVAQNLPGGRPTLAAYFAADRPVDIVEMKRALAGQLPRYMVPTHLVQLDALPLTPNGKIDRDRLPALGSDSVRVRKPPGASGR